VKATLVFEDNNGSVDITGTVDGLADDALPSGAQIMFAYMNTHIEQITEEAQSWFKDELTARIPKILNDE
jgi:hypothetical protein